MTDEHLSALIVELLEHPDSALDDEDGGAVREALIELRDRRRQALAATWDPIGGRPLAPDLAEAMPNHVTTICTITGPHADVLAFAERQVRPREDGKDGRFFDFRTIIPRPAIIDETESGSEAEIGMAALVGDVVWTSFERFVWLPAEVRAELASAPPFAHARIVRVWLAAERPAALEKGRQCLRAIAETGYPDWYQWSIANWGTKWGAYDYAERERGDGRFVFKFETAWSFPEPVFRQLATMYPALVFAVISFDEGWNFACEGEFNGRNDYREDKALATDAMYERVYGEPPDHGD